jgi:hypothetical protein
VRHRARAGGCLVLLTMAAALFGCAPEGAARGAAEDPSRPARPGSKTASPRGLVPITCPGSFQPGLDPALDLTRLTKRCADPESLTAVTPVFVGASQDERSEQERLSFRGRAGRCYRVFSVGAPSVVDLDVAITDDDGRLAAADASGDRFPIVPPRGALCLHRDELFTIHVGVIKGRGSYLLQVWGSEP